MTNSEPNTVKLYSPRSAVNSAGSDETVEEWIRPRIKGVECNGKEMTDDLRSSQ